SPRSMRGVMHRFVSLLVVMAAMSVLATACSSGDSSDAAPEGLPADTVAQGLCQAAAMSGTDAAGAEESFARVHSDLHVVARALQQVDRKAAAAVLVAKQKVEDDFRRRAPASELTPDLNGLLAATQNGFVRLEVTVAPCDR
ncbi:MAG: hypothetical protein ACRD0O_13155, partial [Acidimicrobiia bacterium]